MSDSDSSSSSDDDYLERLASQARGPKKPAAGSQPLGRNAARMSEQERATAKMADAARQKKSAERQEAIRKKKFGSVMSGMAAIEDEGPPAAPITPRAAAEPPKAPDAEEEEEEEEQEEEEEKEEEKPAAEEAAKPAAEVPAGPPPTAATVDLDSFFKIGSQPDESKANANSDSVLAQSVAEDTTLDDATVANIKAGQTFNKKKQFPEAVAAWEKALAVISDNKTKIRLTASLTGSVGLALRRQGETRAAINKFTAAATICAESKITETKNGSKVTLTICYFNFAQTIL
jgi:hypothetical protein